jgi:hypothetical protein
VIDHGFVKDVAVIVLALGKKQIKLAERGVANSMN